MAGGTGTAVLQRICPRGHYYDGNRYSECPYCKSEDVSIGETKPIIEQDDDMTQRVDTSRPVVVGWLVCVGGGDKGRDFRLHCGNNSIGRGANQDVILSGDKAISRQHFNIHYDQFRHKYFASMGEGRQLVYVNDEPLSGTMKNLVADDKIEVANTTLIFIPMDKKYIDMELEN